MLKKFLCLILFLTIATPSLPMDFPNVIRGMHDDIQQKKDIDRDIYKKCSVGWLGFSAIAGLFAGKKAYPHILNFSLKNEAQQLAKRVINKPSPLWSHKFSAGFLSYIYVGGAACLGTFIAGLLTKFFGIPKIFKRFSVDRNRLMRNIRNYRQRLYDNRNRSGDITDMQRRLNDRTHNFDNLQRNYNIQEQELRRLRNQPGNTQRLQDDLQRAQTMREFYRGQLHQAREDQQQEVNRRNELQNELTRLQRELVMAQALSHQSLLVRAIAANNTQEVRRICDGQSDLIKVRDTHGFYPIHYVRPESLEILQVLGEHGALLVNASAETRHVIRENQDILKYFVQSQWAPVPGNDTIRECPICKEELGPEGFNEYLQGLRMHPCGHMFCQNCFERYPRCQLCNRG